ncbi:MAG TPA: hypothetical protein VM095_16290 [Pyrinomonadaceae bacterium]|nr:hypothetical protein [Pyrinomonadaceae bacterium]
MSKRFLITLCLLLFLFFPLLWISQYNYPSGDDFFIAVTAKRLGAVEATKWWYFNRSGRYSYLFLQSLISSSDSWLTLYKVFPVTLLFAGFGCLYYFVRAFFGSGFCKTTLFILSAALYTLLISLTADISTGFYWLTTSIQYSGAVFTSLLIFALYINFSRTKKPAAKAIYGLFIAVLIALLAGLNEVSALFFIGTLGFINLLHIVKFKRPDNWSMAFFALSIMLALVSFLAPGTHARIGQIGPELHRFNVLAGAIGMTLYLLTEVLTSTPILPVSILYLAFLNANRDKLDGLFSLLRGVRWRWILLFMLLTITAVNAVIFTAVGVNSLPDRLKNVYVYSVFFGWLLLMSALFVELAGKKIDMTVPRWITGALVVFVVGFLLTGYKLELSSKNIIPSSAGSRRFFSLINTKGVYANAYLDILSGRAERFSRQNEERAQSIINATGDSVEFPLYSNVPETIFVQDVNHPFGEPDWLSVIISGEVKHLDYVETGPPPLAKKKF